MAKRKYDCECGQFSIRRGNLTRRQYADKKRVHAFGEEPAWFGEIPTEGCAILAREIRQSGGAGLAPLNTQLKETDNERFIS